MILRYSWREELDAKLPDHSRLTIAERKAIRVGESKDETLARINNRERKYIAEARYTTKGR